MVTLEDILEQLVGDIYDESDEIVHEFQKTAPHTYQCIGTFSVVDICSALEPEDEPQQLPKTDSVTIGGWIMDLLGHIPTVGETTDIGTFHFTVLEIENQTIKTVQLQVVPPVSESGTSTESDA